jgi:uncharacterized protein YecE (DUF72 family)
LEGWTVTKIITPEPQFHLGTAGWSYKDWTGVFYPPRMQAGEWLEYYSRFFNCIEVNSSYYSRVNINVLRGWLKKTAERNDFSFILKLHQLFTHKKQLDKEELSFFKANLDELQSAGKLRGILMQFPYSFGFDGANIRFLDSLNGAFSSYPRFLEVRHKSWHSADALAAVASSGMSLCVIDQPQIGSSIPFSVETRSDKLYVRLHGRNEKAWRESLGNYGAKQTYEQQSERYHYLYSRGELIEIVFRIKEQIEKLKEVIIITNNHPYGNAVMNAFELIEYLKVKVGEEIPEQTKNKMRELGITNSQ